MESKNHERMSREEIHGHLWKSAKDIQDAQNPGISLRHQLQSAQQSVQHLAQAFAAVNDQPVGHDEPTCLVNIRWMAAELSVDDLLHAMTERMLEWRAKEEELFYKGQSLASPEKVRQAISYVHQVRAVAEAWFREHRPDIEFQGKMSSQMRTVDGGDLSEQPADQELSFQPQKASRRVAPPETEQPDSLLRNLAMGAAPASREPGNLSALAEELTQRMLHPRAFLDGFHRGLFLSASRPTGTAPFIWNELVPRIKRAGAEVVHVDLATSPPGSLYDSVHRSVTTNFSARGLTQALLGPLEPIEDASFASIFTAWVDTTRNHVVLIVDAVEKAYGNPDGLTLMRILKAARDAVNIRSDTPGHLIFIGLGSDPRRLQIMALSSSEPFFCASVDPLL